MKFLIPGGTGNVGDTLIPNLLKAGHQVIVVTRNKNRVKNSWKDQVEFFEFDLSNNLDSEELEKLKKLIASVDGIASIIGENVFSKRWSAKQKEKLVNSRVLATSNLVTVINDISEKPKVFVTVSGTDIYPPADEAIVYTEDEDNLSSSFLGELSQQWENPVHDLKGVRSVIFRMGVAFSYTGKAAERMFLTHKLFIGGWIGSGSQIYSWIHIEDFAGLIQWALENDQARGIYNGVAPEYKTMKQLAQIGGKILGRWTWTWAPGFMMKLVLGERADMLLKGRAVSSKKVQDAGYKFKFPTAEGALKDILTH